MCDLWKATFETHLEYYNKHKSGSEDVPVLTRVRVRFGVVADVAAPMPFRGVSIPRIP